MTHSKLDLVLFCNAYESEEIAYEKSHLKKAVKRQKIVQSITYLPRQEVEHDEEYEKLKREVMQILSKKLFNKCLKLTDDALDLKQSLSSSESLSKALRKIRRNS